MRTLKLQSNSKNLRVLKFGVTTRMDYYCPRVLEGAHVFNRRHGNTILTDTDKKTFSASQCQPGCAEPL